MDSKGLLHLSISGPSLLSSHGMAATLRSRHQHRPHGPLDSLPRPLPSRRCSLLTPSFLPSPLLTNYILSAPPSSSMFQVDHANPQMGDHLATPDRFTPCRSRSMACSCPVAPMSDGPESQGFVLMSPGLGRKDCTVACTVQYCTGGTVCDGVSSE